jgi:hypothetical protein
LLARADFQKSVWQILQTFFMEKFGVSARFRESDKMKKQENQQPIKAPSRTLFHTISLQMQIDH